MTHHGASEPIACHFDFMHEDVRQGDISYFDLLENVRVTFDTWLPRGQCVVVYVHRAAHEPVPPQSSRENEELVASMLQRAIPRRTLLMLMRRAANCSGALQDDAATAAE